ncbi:DUF6522 family protein [Methylobacterium sp. J-070]|uniref:DUF6522 family protein n=1 Tax=Methylobacterium sp. J-070 TaxID=2836650 RepID=UPI001FBBBA63|nr:DUF6522 family protein [Methylobacterium sp. J-070]MCJ2049376.1 DUF6522 family protein [Methylobacterium sp. J-070]
MRLDLDEQGGWLIKPAELARRLGVAEWSLRREAALDCIDSRLDRGYGRDEGRSRVTITVGKVSWQGIFGPNSQLLSEFRWESQRSTMAINRRRAMQDVEADRRAGKESAANLKSA